MILLREALPKDGPAIHEMSQIPGFFNLPADRDELLDKIRYSNDSFSGKIEDTKKRVYLFVAEDLETGKIAGTSMIAAQHGTEASPHFFFKIDAEEKYSESINTGFIHGTLELGADMDGPSEIGSLVVAKDYRDSPDRVGRQIAFVRFLFLAANRNLFQEQVIAELLPPLNKKGRSPLWEAIGRRFTNMDYHEADRLCSQNKEFIFSLFPSGKIYTTFFPADARNAIGKVSKVTEPIFHMLKKIGFKYKNQVDPFDGGPHLWVDVKDIVPVKKENVFEWDPTVGLSAAEPEKGLFCKHEQKKGEFRAVHVPAVKNQSKINIADSKLAEKVVNELHLQEGDRVHFMPYY